MRAMQADLMCPACKGLGVDIGAVVLGVDVYGCKKRARIFP